MLKCTAFKGKHKIRDRWKNTIDQVTEQPLGKLPVYKIKSTKRDDKTKVCISICCYHYSPILEIILMKHILSAWLIKL